MNTIRSKFLARLLNYIVDRFITVGLLVYILVVYTSSFEVCNSYRRTLGLIGGGGGMTIGSILKLSLYYRGASNNIVPVAATPIIYSPADFPTTTHFIDFEVELPEVQATDAWAGQ